MKFAFFGYNIGIEILIFIGVLYLIIVMNTMYSCCNWNGIKEGLTNPTETTETLQTNTSLPTDSINSNPIMQPPNIEVMKPISLDISTDTTTNPLIIPNQMEPLPSLEPSKTKTKSQCLLECANYPNDV